MGCILRTYFRGNWQSQGGVRRYCFFCIYANNLYKNHSKLFVTANGANEANLKTVLRQNCGTEKGIVIFDLSGCGFLGKKVRKSESRKRRFICDLSAFLEKGMRGYCVCQIFFVPLQRFICVYALAYWVMDAALMDNGCWQNRK